MDWVRLSRSLPRPAIAKHCLGALGAANGPTFVRYARYQAYESGLDPEELSSARTWFANFRESSLPRGNTTFSRSSGAGGQHVNK
jgi:hypothetical protein